MTILGDIPKGWAVTSVGEVAKYQNGRAFKPTEWGKTGLPIIRIQNLNDAGAVFNFSDQPHEERFRVNHGDLLYAWSASLGAYIWKGQQAWLNQHIFRVDHTPGVDRLFLYYALMNITSELYAKAHGSGMVHVTKAKFEETKLWLPPLNEQRRIVAKIDELFSKLDKGVESLKTARTQLKVYRQAVLKNAFQGKLTAQWREENKDKLVTTEHLYARITRERAACAEQRLTNWRAAVATWEEEGKSGKKPPKPRTPKYPAFVVANSQSNPYWTYLPLDEISAESVLGKMLDRTKNRGASRRYLGNLNVRWGKFDLENLKTMKIEDNEIQRYSLVKGDLVICEGGEPGRCAVWIGENNTMFLQKALHRVRFTKSYSPNFAYYFMTYAAGADLLTPNFTGSTIKHLTGKGLANVSFPLCNLAEQELIVRYLDRIFGRCDQLEREIEYEISRADSLYQSVLRRAFSGELVEQDPNDEPAAALLKRIKAERASQKPRAKTRRRKVVNA